MKKKWLTTVLGMHLLIMTAAPVYSESDELNAEVLAIAQKIAASNKSVRGVLALLLPRYTDVIYSLNKLKFSEEEIWNIYHVQCRDDLGTFARYIREKASR